jgi:hypothetical protein
MTSVVKSVATVVSGLWVGISFAIGFIVAPYLFILAGRNSPDVPHTGVAANLIGPLLHTADLITLISAAVVFAALIFLRQRGQRPLGARWYLPQVAVCVSAACAAANYFGVFPRIKSIRTELAEQYGAFHLADKSHPLYQQFDSLHHTSTTLFTVSFVAGLVVLVCLTQVQPKGTSA